MENVSPMEDVFHVWPWTRPREIFFSLSYFENSLHFGRKYTATSMGEGRSI